MVYSFNIYFNDDRNYMLYVPGIQDPNKICDKDCRTMLLIYFFKEKDRIHKSCFPILHVIFYFSQFLSFVLINQTTIVFFNKRVNQKPHWSWFLWFIMTLYNENFRNIILLVLWHFSNTLFFKCYRSEKVMGHFYNNMLCAYISSLFQFKENAKIFKHSGNCELIGPAIKYFFFPVA